MTASQIQELLRKILEREPVSVLTFEGKEIAVSGLNFGGGKMIGYSDKFTGEMIPAESVETVIL